MSQPFYYEKSLLFCFGSDGKIYDLKQKTLFRFKTFKISQKSVDK